MQGGLQSGSAETGGVRLLRVHVQGGAHSKLGVGMLGNLGWDEQGHAQPGVKHPWLVTNKAQTSGLSVRFNADFGCTGAYQHKAWGPRSRYLERKAKHLKAYINFCGTFRVAYMTQYWECVEQMFDTPYFLLKTVSVNIPEAAQAKAGVTFLKNMLKQRRVREVNRTQGLVHGKIDSSAGV